MDSQDKARKKAYDREYRLRPGNRERIKARVEVWVKNNPDRVRELRRRRNSIDRKKHRIEVLARNAAARAKIPRQPCEVCGNGHTEYHHDDYSKPLEVRHLCRKHHRETHRTNHEYILPTDTTETI